MWFGVAPVTPPYVRRRDARLHRQPPPHARPTASDSPWSPSPSPRTRSLPLAAAVTSPSPRGRDRALSVAAPPSETARGSPRSDGTARGSLGTRRERRLDRVVLAALVPRGPDPLGDGDGDGDGDEDGDEDEEPATPRARGPSKSRGPTPRALEPPADGDNQQSAAEPSLLRPSARPKAPEASGRPISAVVGPQRPGGPDPAPPRSRRASRTRAGRVDGSIALVPADPDAPPGGLVSSLPPLVGWLKPGGGVPSGCIPGPSSGVPGPIDCASRAPTQAVAVRAAESLTGHASSVCALAAGDDRVLASGARDGLVKLWSRVSFLCLQTLGGHDDNVSSLDVRGDWLVSGSHDETLRLYRRPRRSVPAVDPGARPAGPEFALHGVLRGHAGRVTQAALPEALPGLVLSCSDDATLRLWDAERALCVLVLRLHASRVTCFAVSPVPSPGPEGDWDGDGDGDGNGDGDSPVAPGDCVICSGAADAAVCLWGIQRAGGGGEDDGQPALARARAFRAHRSTVQCVAIAPGGDAGILASGSSDGTIQLFGLRAFEHLAQLHDCASPVYALAAAADRLVGSTRDGRLVLFGDLRARPHGLAGPPWGRPTEVRVAPTWLSSLRIRGDLVACCAEDTLYLVRVAPGAAEAAVRAVPTGHGFINCVRWVHARAVATCGQDHVVKLWDVTL